jgi:hypothetical protein
VEITKCAKEAQQVFFSKNQKPSFIPHPKPTNHALHATPLKIYKLTRPEMFECQPKDICYNCDDKYFSRHKFKEQNIFVDIYEDVVDDEFKFSPIEEITQKYDLIPPSNPP